MTTEIGHPQNADQISYWNGPDGRHWAKRQQAQDAMLAPISDFLIERSSIRPGECVIDIGCGCGATAIASAEKVGPSGHVSGIDISEPMLARARELAPRESQLEFVLADAMVHAFAEASADLVISRFGVMFFAEPERAFANIRTGIRSGGRLAFVCWRQPRENPWMMVPLQAVYQHVPKLPPVGPEEPGPFAFASAERVDRILRGAGFTNVAIRPHDCLLDLAIGNGLDAAVDAAIEMGPASLALKGHPPDAIDAATASVRKALSSFEKGASVLLPAAIWIVTASQP
jgi:SAM-dependent methyltransferase